MNISLADWAVLELCEGYGTAALAGKILADLGSPVVRIESGPRGAAALDLVNGSKSRVSIDVDQSNADAPLRLLLRQASILLVDQTAWAALRGGLHGADPHLLFPHLTICLCSPFGQSGPMAGWQGGETLVQAVSGVMSTTGDLHAGPTRVGGQVLTHAAALSAVTAIIADRMGLAEAEPGRLIDLAILDVAISFMTSAWPFYALHGVAPTGIGNRHTMAAPWNSYPCRDGWLILCAGNDPTWRRLCTAIGRPDLVTDPRFDTQESRVRNTEALDAEVAAWTQNRAMVEAEAALDAHGVPAGPALTLFDVLKHPQFAARGLLRQTEGGPLVGGLFQRDGAALPVTRQSGDATWPCLRAAGAATADLERWCHTAIIPADNAKVFHEPAA